jgi:hypothetical protein
LSYFDQIEKNVSVILCSPECVEGAADADSQLSFLRSLGPGLPPGKATTSSQTAFFVDASTANLRRTRSTMKILQLEPGRDTLSRGERQFAKKEGQRLCR